MNEHHDAQCANDRQSDQKPGTLDASHWREGLAKRRRKCVRVLRTRLDPDEQADPHTHHQQANLVPRAHRPRDQPGESKGQSRRDFDEHVRPRTGWEGVDAKPAASKYHIRAAWELELPDEATRYGDDVEHLSEARKSDHRQHAGLDDATLYPCHAPSRAVRLSAERSALAMKPNAPQPSRRGP